MNSGFITQIEPPVLPGKSEPLVVIKNEAPESEIMEIAMDDIFNTSDSKDVDIVSHTLCEGLIKSETISENLFETVFVKTENVKIENIIESENLITNEDTSDDIDLEVVEAQDSNEYSNELGNLESDKQLVICYQTVETTSWDKDKEKINVIKAPVIPVEAHEYTSLAKGKYVCNYCQHTYNVLGNIRRHINQMHRKLTTMYQCPYCLYDYKSKWSVREHIIRKHKDTKDIQWFQCHLCEWKFKLKNKLNEHMKVHLKHNQMKDGLDLREKSYHCDNCDYKAYRHPNLKKHNLVHFKPEDIPYFHCYHCSYKSNCKRNLERHIFGLHFKNIKQGKRHHCDKCDYETYTSTKLKSHKLTHLKPEEIQYFYCYHCCHKAKRKPDLKIHIFKHFKREQVQFDCYICDFMTSKRKSIIKHIKEHSKVQDKSEI